MAYNLQWTSVNLEMEEERQQPASYYPTSGTYSRIEGGKRAILVKDSLFPCHITLRLSDLGSTPGGTLNFIVFCTNLCQVFAVLQTFSNLAGKQHWCCRKQFDPYINFFVWIKRLLLAFTHLFDRAELWRKYNPKIDEFSLLVRTSANPAITCLTLFI
nr:hypothetical protein Iba_chr05aCG16910 [Ipomoea batatas]